MKPATACPAPAAEVALLDSTAGVTCAGASPPPPDPGPPRSGAEAVPDHAPRQPRPGPANGAGSAHDAGRRAWGKQAEARTLPGCILAALAAVGTEVSAQVTAPASQ